MVENFSSGLVKARTLEVEVSKVIRDNSYILEKDDSKSITLPNETVYRVRRNHLEAGREVKYGKLRITRAGEYGAISDITLDCSTDDAGQFWGLGYALDSFTSNNARTYVLTVHTPFNSEAYMKTMRRQDHSVWANQKPSPSVLIGRQEAKVSGIEQRVEYESEEPE